MLGEAGIQTREQFSLRSARVDGTLERRLVVHPAILNRQLRYVNCELDNGRLKHCTICVVENPDDTLAHRLLSTFGQERPPTVAAKLTLAGTPITYQAIYAWLDGGNVKDKYLEAVAALYKVDRAWLKYGSSQPRSISRVMQAMHGLSPEKQEKIAELIEEMARP